MSTKDENKSSYYWYFPEEIERITDPRDPLFDPRVLLPADPGLVDSILEHGVQEPIAIVRRGAKLFLADGRRRHAAVEEANRRLKRAGNDKDSLIRLPCLHVRGVKPEDAMVIRHSHRLDESTIERAMKAEAMRARGYDDEQIASKHGKSVATIELWKHAMRAPHDAIEKCKSGELSFQALVELGKIEEPAKQVEAMAAIKEVAESDGGRKKGRIVEAVRDTKKGKKRPAATKSEESDARGPLGRAKIRKVCEALAPTKDDEVDPESPEELAWRLMRIVTGDGTPALLKAWPNVARLVREALK